MGNLNINIATVNGTGSLSANQLLTKILFREKWTVGSYNFFPSNIAGLACLYNLRLNSKGYMAFSRTADLLISFNPKTLLDNLKDLKPNGLLITDEKDQTVLKLEKGSLPFKGTHWKFPFNDSLKSISHLNIKTKPFLKNMIYVGLLSEWLKLEKQLIQKTIEDFFQKSKGMEVIEQNLQAIQIGRTLAQSYTFPFSIPKKTLSQKTKDNKNILIDGNTSQALGALFSGCQFLSWYPITPATSLAQSFEKLSHVYQKDSDGKKKCLVLQTEDELAGISQAIGASWAGLRAMTATSGPGLSLMSEAAGLSYFAEIPVVLCNVQRAGPSTGLPTRTQQGDLLSACFLSHGDCKHIVLMPADPEEAFHFTALAFDLAEQLQTLVIVLSDLDLGMNLKISPTINWKKITLQRGKILREKDLENIKFSPYQDQDKDGISYRTLPGVRHAQGAYLNRGSGHNEQAEYSEKPQDYSGKLDKLKRKWETAKTLMPKPVMQTDKNRFIAFVTFGPNMLAVKELQDQLELKGVLANTMRICSFPFSNFVEPFLKQHTDIFVVELNRDGQLKQLLSGEFPQHSHKMHSLLQYDGCPLDITYITKQFDELYFKNLKKKL